MSYTRRGLKPDHLVECTQRDTDAHFSRVSHMWQIIEICGMIPRASRKSFHSSHVSWNTAWITVLCSMTFLSISVHTFFDLHTKSYGHSILAESFNESEPQRNLARRHAVWPRGRTKGCTRKHFSCICFGSSKNSGIGETVFALTSGTTEIAKYVRGPRSRGLFAGNALVIQYLAQKKSGELITADHQDLSERCESRNNQTYAVVIQDLATQWIQIYPWKTKISQDTEKILRKCRWIIILASLCINASPFRDEWYRRKSGTNGIAERAVRRITEETCAELLQSVLDVNGGWKKTCPRLLGGWKNFTKGVSEQHLKARSFRLVQVQLYVAKEETFQIPLKYIDVTSTTHTHLDVYTNLDVLQESRFDDSWHVDEVNIIEWKTYLRVCGPGGGFRRLKQLPDLAMCGLKLGPACQKQLGRRSRKGLLESQRSTTLEEREAFIPSIWKMESYTETIKTRGKVGDSYGGGNALQNGNKEALEEAAGNCRRKWWIQEHPKDKACIHRRNSWNHQDALGTYSIKRSWWSQSGERVQFDTSLKFGVQVCSDASSDEKSGCESSSGYGMEEARKKLPAWQLDKVGS